jgi:hypothetical protein
MSNDKGFKYLALGGGQLKRVAVQVPELGTVYVRELTLRERLEMEQAGAVENAPSRPALLAAACTVDEQGAKLFDLQDAAAIDKLPASLVAPLSRAAGELNNLDQKSEAASVEAAAKNS